MNFAPPTPSRLIAAACIALFAASAAWADKGGKHGHGKHHDHDDRHEYREREYDGRRYDNPRDNISIQMYFGNNDRRIVSEYYGPEVRSGHCPPGLAKKHNGCMPPGKAKKWRKGYPMPAGVVYYDLPPDLVYRMPPPPAGHRYVRSGPDILLIATGSGIVVDAIINFGF